MSQRLITSIRSVHALDLWSISVLDETHAKKCKLTLDRSAKCVRLFNLELITPVILSLRFGACKPRGSRPEAQEWQCWPHESLLFANYLVLAYCNFEPKRMQKLLEHKTVKRFPLEG